MLVQAEISPPDQTARELEAAIAAIRAKLQDARPAEVQDQPTDRSAALAARDAELAALQATLAAAEQDKAALGLELQKLRRDLQRREEAATRQAAALELARKQRDQAVLAEQDAQRTAEAEIRAVRGEASDQRATHASILGALQARLDTSEQERARLELSLAQVADGGKAREREALAEMQHRVDQLTAERDKARDEAASANSVLEARLADARRQLDAMGEEVRLAWQDRAAAEQRTEQTEAQAETAAEQQREAAAEIGPLRAKTAALDAMITDAGRRARADAAELERLEKVAGDAVAETERLGRELLDALAENRTLHQMLARVDRAAAAASPGLVLEALVDVRRVGATSVAAEPGMQTPPEPAAGHTDARSSGAPEALSTEVLSELSGLELAPAAGAGFVAVVDGLAFVEGSARIDRRAQDGIVRIARLMQLSPQSSIRIVGHTDSAGDAARNRELSEQRAAAVRQALVERFAVDPARIAIEGRGADQPIASNRTARGRQANRRVELFVLPSNSAMLGENDAG
jgi:flagellar motor protein MotB